MTGRISFVPADSRAGKNRKTIQPFSTPSRHVQAILDCFARLSTTGLIQDMRDWFIRGEQERQKYSDFSASELDKLNGHPLTPHPCPVLEQTNPLHVLYEKRKWETPRPLHLPNHPIGIAMGHRGFWEASNPIVWKALRPALQLASRMIDNAQFPWWDALSLEEHVDVGPMNASGLNPFSKLKGTRHFGTEHEETRLIVHNILKDLASKTQFCLWSGSTKVYSGLPSEEFLNITTNISRSSNGEKEYLVTLAYEAVEPLLGPDLACEERAVQTFWVACMLANETINLAFEEMGGEKLGEEGDRPDFEGLGIFSKLEDLPRPLDFLINLYLPEFWDSYIRANGIQTTTLNDPMRHEETNETTIGSEGRNQSESPKVGSFIKTPALHHNKPPLRPPQDEPNVLIFDEITAYLFSHRSVLALNSMNFWMPARTLFCYIYREGGFPGLDWDMWLLFLRACGHVRYLFEYSEEGAGVVHRMEKQWPREYLDPLMKPRLCGAEISMIKSFLELTERVEEREQVFQDGFLDHDRDDFRMLCNRHLADMPELQKQFSTRKRKVSRLDKRTFDELLFLCHESKKGFTYGPEGIIRKLVPNYLQLDDYRRWGGYT